MKNIDQKRWGVLAACCLINLCIGSLYAWSVFAGPIMEKINAAGGSVTSLSIVFTIANAVGPITMISGGFINQKMGPKTVITIGGVMFGIGMIASGYVSSMSGIILSYGLLVGLGIGFTYGTTVSTAVKYFPDKKGLAGGLATAAYGISSVVVPPLAVSLLSAFGVQMAFTIIGGIMLAIILVCSLIIKPCPDSYVPSGYVAGDKGAFKSEDKDWKGMLQSPVFYVMLLMLCCGAFSGLMITSSASAIARNHMAMDAVAAAGVVSIIALFNTFGRILAGALSDKIGLLKTAMLSFLLGIVGQACLYFSSIQQSALFYIGASIVGVCFGSMMGIYPSFTSAQFGSKNNSVNYGIMFIGFALAGFFGPTILGKIYASSGNYASAFLVALGLSALGLVLSFVFQSLTKKKA